MRVLLYSWNQISEDGILRMIQMHFNRGMEPVPAAGSAKIFTLSGQGELQQFWEHPALGMIHKILAVDSYFL